jgi:hypothetical protein
MFFVAHSLPRFLVIATCHCNSVEKKEAAPGSSNEYVVYAPAGRLGIVLDSPDKEGPIVYVIKENSPSLASAAATPCANLPCCATRNQK